MTSSLVHTIVNTTIIIFRNERYYSFDCPFLELFKFGTRIKGVSRF